MRPPYPSWRSCAANSNPCPRGRADDRAGGDKPGGDVPVRCPPPLATRQRRGGRRRLSRPVKGGSRSSALRPLRAAGGKVGQNRAVRPGAPWTRRVATAHELAKAGCQGLEVTNLHVHLREMVRGDVAQLPTRPAAISSEEHQRSHLVDREAKVPTASNERQTFDVVLGVKPLAPFHAIGWPEEADLFVVANRRHARARPRCQLTDSHVLTPKKSLEPQVTRGCRVVAGGFVDQRPTSNGLHPLTG